MRCVIYDALGYSVQRILRHAHDETWIDAVKFASARIVARPASNSSFWIRHIEFVRIYGTVPTSDGTTLAFKHSE